MELRQLRFFAAIVRAGSLTQAAADVHIAQQSLSAIVAKLEAELGVRLLERGRFGVRPTVAGGLLADRGAALLADADALARDVQAAGASGPGAVSVRYGLDTEHLVGPLLRAARDAEPELTVSGWTAPDADNVEALRAGEADAAFVWAADRAAPELPRACVAEEACLAAVPEGHPLDGDAEALPVEAVAGRRVVMFPRAAAPAVYDHILAALTADGRVAPVVTDAPMSGQAGMVDAASDSDAVAPVSAGLVRQLARDDVRLMPWSPAISVPLHLVLRPGAPPAAARLLAAVAR